MWDLDK
jgi:hypothetical protein